jgi:hypothetical protein
MTRSELIAYFTERIDFITQRSAALQKQADEAVTVEGKAMMNGLRALNEVLLAGLTEALTIASHTE